MKTRYGAVFTVDTVERALVIHTEKGRIRSWRRTSVRTGTAWEVETTDGSIELRTLREAYAFVYGLGSAAQAFEAALTSTYKGE